MDLYEPWLEITDRSTDDVDAAEDAASSDVCDDGACGPDLGSPYGYEPGTLPGPDDRRGGSVIVSAVPNHVAALKAGSFDEDTDLAEFGVDRVRLWVCAPSVTPAGEDGDYDGSGEGPVEAVVLLDGRQVEALRDALDAWLSAEVRI